MTRRMRITLEDVQKAQEPPEQDTSAGNQSTYDQGNGEDHVFMMTGPMGDMYTKALAVRFAKEPLGQEKPEQVEQVAQEGLMDWVKSLFGSKPKQPKEDESARERAEDERYRAERIRNFGKVNKVLAKLTDARFVKEHCESHSSPSPDASIMIKALNGLLEVQRKMPQVVETIDKVTGSNLTKAAKALGNGADDLSGVGLTDVHPVVRKEISKLPKDFGAGIEFKVVDWVDDDEPDQSLKTPVYVALNETRVLNIIMRMQSTPLTQTEIVTVAKLALELQKNIDDQGDVIPTTFESGDRDGKEWDSEGKIRVGVELGHQHYYSSHQLFDLVFGVDGHIGVGMLANEVLEAALMALNKLILDDKVSLETVAQDAMLAGAAVAQQHIQREKANLSNIRLVNQSRDLIETPQVIAYVVHANDSMKPETVVKINDWVEKAKATKRGVIMICDTTVSRTNWMGRNSNAVDDGKIPTPTEVGQTFTRATEDYYEALGVPVIFGMEGFVDYLGKNYGSPKYKSIATRGFGGPSKRFFTDSGSRTMRGRNV